MSFFSHYCNWLAFMSRFWPHTKFRLICFIYSIQPTFFFLFIPVYIIILFCCNSCPTKSASYFFFVSETFHPYSLLCLHHYVTIISTIIPYLCQNNHLKTFYNNLLYCNFISDLSAWKKDVWLCGDSEHRFCFFGLNARCRHIAHPSQGW